MISDKAYTIKYGGQTFRLHYTSDVDVAVKEGGGVGRFQELELLEEIQKMGLGGTYVDVGANVGNHTLFFASFTPASRVIAIEAHPLIASVLRRNVDHNPQKAAIQLRFFAAWDYARTSLMGDPVPGNAGRSQLYGLGKFGGTKHTVRCAKLDDELEGIDDISVLKMDIEDAEIPAMKGALKILETQMPVLISEHHTGRQLCDAQKILEPLGYKLQPQAYDPRGETKLWLPS